MNDLSAKNISRSAPRPVCPSGSGLPAIGTCPLPVSQWVGKAQQATGSSRPPINKLLEVTSAISPFLLTSPFLQKLDSKQLRALCAIAVPKQVVKGDTLYKVGEIAPFVYLILQGRVELLGTSIRSCDSGELIGESMIMSTPRYSETARATSFLRLLALPVSVVRNIMRSSESSTRGQPSRLRDRLILEGLRRCELFGGLPQDILRALATHCSLQSYRRGELIEVPVSRGKDVCIVVSGTLSCRGHFSHDKRASDDLGEGAVFRQSGVQAAEVIRARTAGWLLRLERRAIASILFPCADARQRFGLFL